MNNTGRLRPIKVGPAVKQLCKRAERSPGMREITIWIEDDNTGNKVQVENGDVKSLDQAYHLIYNAWQAIERVNDGPKRVNDDLTGAENGEAEASAE